MEEQVAASLKKIITALPLIIKVGHKESTASGTPYDELYLENFTQSNSNIKTSEILTTMCILSDATEQEHIRQNL